MEPPRPPPTRRLRTVRTRRSWSARSLRQTWRALAAGVPSVKWSRRSCVGGRHPEVVQRLDHRQVAFGQLGGELFDVGVRHPRSAHWSLRLGR